MLKSRLKGAIARLQTAYRQKTAKIHPNPILILGHQKSGTTVIAALLGQVSGKAVIIDPFHQIDLKAQWRTQLFQQEIALEEIINQRKSYFSTPLVKDPNFTFLYPQLKQCFPNAQYVLVMRDPRDTIRSVLNRLQLPGNLPTLDAKGWQKLDEMDAKGWQYMLQGHLPDVPGRTYIERLANRWNLAAKTYLDGDNEIVLVRYEDFLKDKVETIENLAQKVGLEPIRDIANQVNVQYQSRGDRAVSWLDFFGKENLTKIEAICEAQMQRLNYPQS